MKYTVVKGTNIHRASIEQPDGKCKVVALFGKVKELAEKNIIFLDGKPATDTTGLSRNGSSGKLCSGRSTTTA